MSEQTLIFQYEGEIPQRLDKFLVSYLPEYSRTYLQNLIKDGFVNVQGQAAYKTGQLVESGNVVHIRIPPPQPSHLQPEAIPLDILYENPDLLVVNKPAGMVVHPGAGHAAGTLVQAALAHAPEMEGVGGEQRPGVVHRLDKDTSGIILLAKNDQAHRWLQEQFSQRRAEKIYLALVDGHPPTPTGRIDAAIGRSEHDRRQMAVVTPTKGRAALSEYRTLESFPRHTYLEVHPITGRTHQIRLHLRFLGCPVVGDQVYGLKNVTVPLEHHFLHAQRLTIRLPGESELHRFEAPLPDELAQVLQTLRRN